MTMKRLLKRISFLFVCVLFTQLAFSQTKVITGTINDDKGAAVQGATVSVKGSKGGTTTDAAGFFTLTVPTTAKSIIVSSVGFLAGAGLVVVTCFIYLKFSLFICLTCLILI